METNSVICFVIPRIIPSGDTIPAKTTKNIHNGCTVISTGYVTPLIKPTTARTDAAKTEVIAHADKTSACNIATTASKNVFMVDVI